MTIPAAGIKTISFECKLNFLPTIRLTGFWTSSWKTLTDRNLLKFYLITYIFLALDVNWFKPLVEINSVKE